MRTLLRPPPRFLRTAHLERDFGRAGVLDGYVSTSHIVDTIGRIAASLLPDATHRAWRVTGDYGTGKSSLGLALAHLFSGDSSCLPSTIDAAVTNALGRAARPRLLPVLLTGTREGIAPALSRSLAHARARLGLAEPEILDVPANPEGLSQIRVCEV